MHKKLLSIPVAVYENEGELPENLHKLVHNAKQHTRNAYAPYSNFYVGAAVLLADGSMVNGCNQENGAYPSGLCAERVALFSVGAAHPQAEVKAIAVVATRDHHLFLDCSPCGACRQVMLEFEQKQGQPIQVVFQMENGKLLLFNAVKDILPFAFEL